MADNAWLLDKRSKAKVAMEDFENSFKAVYPARSPIQWLKNGHVRTGHVDRHFYGDRLQVENHETGKMYAIHMYDVLAVDAEF